jgi:hypothetical protein
MHASTNFDMIAAGTPVDLRRLMKKESRRHFLYRMSICVDHRKFDENVTPKYFTLESTSSFTFPILIRSSGNVGLVFSMKMHNFYLAE